MVTFLKNHEKYVSEKLEKGECDWEWLRDYHKTQIEYLQHERLIHLMVTLSFALFFIVTILFVVSFEKTIILAASTLIFFLLR